MSGWAPKRFWKEARVAEVDGGWTVTLDGRKVRTPAKADFVVPTRALAESCAAEWAAQDELVRPDTMPHTRTANSAIDKVRAQHGEVAALVAAYGETDLTCYRAEGPDELVARQAAAWDPLIGWAETALGARLVPVAGVMHQAQASEALARLAEATVALDAFELAAFHDLVALSGSLVIGFAAARGARAPEALWEDSRIDESWQAEQWGDDDEALARRAKRHEEFTLAAEFAGLTR